MIGEKKLKRAIQKLHNEIKVVANEHVLADVATDGLFPKEESSAMITGLLGGKGMLDNGTDIDKVSHGGIYYLPETRNYVNDPHASNGKHTYREILTVVRNFGGNPHTVDPMVYQEIKTLNLNGGNWTAYRIWLSGKWNPWIFPHGKRIYSGGISVNGTTLNLSDNIRNFRRVRICWAPYQEHNKEDTVVVNSNQAQFELKNLNMPDDMSAPNPYGNQEEVILKINSGSKSLTCANHFYLQTPKGLQADKDRVNANLTKILYIDGYKD